MLCKAVSVALMAVLTAGLVSAGGGGKIKWNDCKNDKDFDRVLADCKATGTPLMVLFSSDCCPACQGLCSGALSSDEVVKASERMIRISADNGRLTAVAKRFNISSIPQIVFCDSDGKEVGRMRDSSASGLSKQMNDVADQHTRAPTWVETLDAGLESGKADHKPVVMFFHEDGQKSVAAEKAFSDLAVADYLAKFSWVKIKTDLKSDEAKTYGLKALPAMWILDPAAEVPTDKPLRQITLPKAGAALKAEFAAVLKGWDTEKK